MKKIVLLLTLSTILSSCFQEAPEKTVNTAVNTNQEIQGEEQELTADEENMIESLLIEEE